MRTRERRAWRRRASLAAVAGLVLTALSLVDAPVEAAPGESLQVSLDASPSVLVGESGTVEVRVVNDGDRPEYNLSLRTVLPAGVTYVGGSTAPDQLGEPQQVGLPGGETVLLWPNVSDLPRGGDQRLTFEVATDPAVHPVGSSFPLVADAYASANPRVVPRFGADGTQTTGASVSGTSSAAVTAITAIQIEKSEPSPEHELLRGVHDHPTTYTLTVTNNAEHDDDQVVVVDLLPAQLELLGCGGVDNSRTREYDGAAPLSATPAVAGCRTPYAVTTVLDPPGHTGVFTRVEWRLGTLTPGEVVTIRYAAGIPQRANTMDFAGPTPTPTSLAQVANLDNNTGPSTREGATEQALSNVATVEADYTGPVAAGTAPPTRVGDTARLTVTAEDLAVQKHVTPGTFRQGGVATFTFDLQTSEYATADDIVLTDVLPNGLCPIGAGLPLCADALGNPPSVPFADVSENADGTFRIVFEPIAMTGSGSRTRTVTFEALMLARYRADQGDTTPTVAGDSFTNRVSLTGTTTDVPAVEAPDPGPVAVGDDSAATIRGEEVQLVKKIQPNTGAAPATCSTDAVDYVDSAPYLAPGSTLDPADITFSEGSRVCFLLEVDFPGGAFTKNPVLADFLPDNLTYETGSVTPVGGHDTPFALDEGDLVFSIGDPSGADRFVAAGGRFRVSLSGIVNSPADPGGIDVPGNLAKLRWTNSTGKVSFLRDREQFRVPPPPPATVTKKADRISAVPPGTAGPLPDGATALALRVRAGDVVEYTATLGNGGTAAQGNTVALRGPETWDRLPAGITCAVVGAISDGGVCTDPGAAGHPTFTGDDVRSAIRWALPATGPGAVVIAPGDSHVLTYRVTYPASTSAAGAYRNDIDVTSYSTLTNVGDLAGHHPADNVDRTLPASEVDAPAAHDDHTLRAPAAGITKTNTTGIGDVPAQGTDPARSYAVVGESVTYTVIARLPARTTVYGGVLSDPLPSNLQLVSVAYDHSSDDGGTWGPLPAGSTSTTPPAVPQVRLPATLDTGAEDDLVRLVVTARVLAGAAHEQVRTNTATFTSTDENGAARPDQSASSAVTLVKPNPAPVKTATPTAPVAGQRVDYTVRARNLTPATPGQHRPVLRDTVLVDCVPAGLAVDAATVAVTAGSAQVHASGVEAHGCATGTTAVVWTVGDLPWRSPSDAAGASPWPVLTYSANVSPAAGGGGSYTNTVTETGSSLLGTDPTEESYAGTAAQTVQVPGGTLTKTVTPQRAPVGDTVTYTVGVTLPQSVNFYDATVVDQLPAGIAPGSVALAAGSPSCRYTDGAAEACAGGDDLTGAAALTVAGQSHGWFLGDIAAASRPRRVEIAYTAVVSAAGSTNHAGDVLANTARLRWNQADRHTTVTDPAATFDQSTTPGTASVTVLEPDLSVTKAVSASRPRPGETFTYTVTVRNRTGADVSSAHNVDVRDVVPAGVVVDPAGISRSGILTGGADGAGTIDWTGLGPIAPGGTLVLTYTARLRSPAPTTAQTNTVTVTGYTSLADPAAGRGDYPDETATAQVRPALPALVVGKDVLDPAPSYRGRSVRWQITVDNAGEALAHDVDVRDVLPAGWRYDSGSARISVAGAPAGAVEPVVGGDPQTLLWSDLGDLAVGERITVVLAATPGSGAPVGSGTTHVNEAVATAKDVEGGTVVTTGQDDAATRIDSASLRMTKSVVGRAVAGAAVTWHLDVANDGPDAAVGPFVVTDSLPAGLSAVTAAGTGWTCGVTPPASSGTGASVRCERPGSLAVGAVLPTITVRGTLPADRAPGTDLANHAAVTGGTHDPVPADDEDEVTSTVTAVADLGIQKSLGGAGLVPGTTATYALDVTNHGPSVARGPLRVVDTLPAGLTYDSFTGADWELADRDGQQLTFAYRGGDAPVGTLPQIVVSVRVAPDLRAAVTNRAEVTEPTDPTTGPEQPDSDEVVTTPTPKADLSLGKSHVGDLKAGTRGTYRFVVTNRGPSDASGPLSVRDELPDGVRYVAGSASAGWTCTAVGQVLTCTRPGGLAASGSGATATFDITVALDEGLTGDVVNAARVSSPTDDPNPVDNGDDDDSGIGVEADLAITKTLRTDPVVAGEPVTYDLAVRNEGPATSPGPVTVTDVLPAGLGYVEATGTGWSCAEDDGTITCVRAAALANGAAAPVITVRAAVASGVGTTTLVNTASVDGPATDPVPGNDSDAEDTPVTEDAELVLTKTTLGSGRVRAGETVSFAVDVASTGSSDARAVTVVDRLPAGLSLVSISGTGWDCTGLVCTRDRVVAGRSAPTLTVVARVSSAVPDGSRLVNEAETSTSTRGDDPADDVDRAAVDVDAEADLGIVKTHPSGTAVAGRATTYRLAVTNHGPSNAVGPVTVTDQLPAGLSYLSASAPWACVPGAGRTVTCTLTDGIVAGADAPVLQLQVVVVAGLGEGAVGNTASVTSPTTDPVPGNDEDDVPVDVTRTADVWVRKSHTAAARVGDDLAFTLRVGNDGPSTARDVVLLDRLPAGLDAVSAAGDGWTCGVSPAVRCTLDDDLAPGTEAEPVTVVATVRAAAYPRVENVAEVTTSTTDTDPDDDRATDVVEVPARVDLAIRKELVGDLVVGETGHYRVVVRNDGRTPAPGPVTVTDALPEGLTYVAARGDGWSCAAPGGVVTCTRVDVLGVGAESTIALDVEVGPAAYPSVVNTARVTSPAEDDDPSNDSDDVTGTVRPTVRLDLTKEVAARSGADVSYRITVTNRGPSDSVRPIVVTDRLPARLELVGVDGPSWSCATAGRLVTCTRAGVLPVGASAGLVVRTRIVGTGTEAVVNTAQVVGGGDVDAHEDSAGIEPPAAPDADGLPDTGGPRLPLLLAGLLALGLGTALVRRART